MKKKYQVSLIVITLMLVCTIFVATSYALWSITVVQNDSNIVTTGCFDATLNQDNPITLNNTYPITEAAGLATTPYTFTIKNTCSIAASYEISLESLADSTLGNEYLRVSLDKQMSNLYSELNEVTNYYNTSLTSRFLTKGKLGAGETATYDLRLWLDYNATLETTANKTFEAKIIVLNTATSYETLSQTVALGDYISLSPTATTYQIEPSLTGYSTTQTINPRELNMWRVIRKNANGSVDVVSEHVSSVDVHFNGKEGYKKFAGSLNTIASQYTNSKYVTATRYLGYNGQTVSLTDESVLTATTAPWQESTTNNTNEVHGGGDVLYTDDYTSIQSALGTIVGTKPNGTVSAYWLASRAYSVNGSIWSFNGRIVNNDGSLSTANLYNYSGGYSDGDSAYSIRPVLTLKSSLETISGDGKSESTAYTFE